MLVAVACFCSVLAAQAPRPAPQAASAPRPIAEALRPEQLKFCDEASKRGLQWLADHQLSSGAWTGLVGHKMNDDYMILDQGLSLQQQRAQGRGHMGVSALAGMAFLAGGHLPDRGPHGKVVQKLVDYTLQHAMENGFVTDSGTRMYSHAFATLFLAEVYGMAGGKPVKLALEKAVNLIVDSQNQLGGWRYNPFDRELDLSVTVCQLQALRAARNIGIKVPSETIDRAIAYVQQSRTTRGRDQGLFYYKVYGRGRYEKNREYAINAAALTALSSAGIYDPALHQPVFDFLEADYTNVATYWGEHFYFWYGNYYACQAFFQTGGERFPRYFNRLSQDLLRHQQDDGRWQNDTGPGDEFATAMACILLQVQKQYLPIFQR